MLKPSISDTDEVVGGRELNFLTLERMNEKAQYEQLVADAKKLTQDIMSLTDETREGVTEGLAEAGKKARQFGQQADEYAHEHVWKVAAVSAVMGALLASLFGRSRRP